MTLRERCQKKSLSCKQLKDCTQFPYILKIGLVRPDPRSHRTIARAAGFLTLGSLYSPRLPIPLQRNSGLLRLSSPITAAGPLPTSTGFPVQPGTGTQTKFRLYYLPAKCKKNGGHFHHESQERPKGHAFALQGRDHGNRTGGIRIGSATRTCSNMHSSPISTRTVHVAQIRPLKSPRDRRSNLGWYRLGSLDRSPHLVPF